MPNRLPDERAESTPPAAPSTETISPPVPVSPAQRRELRAQAHHIDPVVMVGESGLTRGVLAEIGRALDSHELIKVRVFGDDREERSRIMERICSILGCAPVQMIGKLLVLWRPSADKTPKTPRPLSKKKAAQAALRPSDERGSKSARPSGRPTARTPAQSPARKPAGASAARTVAGRSTRPSGTIATPGRPRSPASADKPRASSAAGSRISAQARPAAQPRATGGAKPRSPASSKPRSTGAAKPRSTGSTGGPRNARGVAVTRSRPAATGRPSTRKKGSHS